MKFKFLAVSIALSCLVNNANASSVYDCEDGDDSLACRQKENIEEIWVDMNQSASTVVDDIMTAPEAAVEAGCLDDIRSIDLSVMTVDPYSLWSEIYSSLKDQLTSQVCSAVEDKINEQTEKLDTTLEAPLGLGEVSVSNSYDINSFDELTETRVKLTNDEAKKDVVESVFGSSTVRSAKHFTEKSMDRVYLEKNGTTKRAVRTSEEEELESALDFNRLWSTESETDDDN
tara:strand:- start:3776 stop:4465 length:690 start_codon:yes stop_codon:yes gene_type:complete